MLKALKTIKNAIKYWYIQLIVGLIFVGVGIWAFITPLDSYLALSFIFSISFLVSGIFKIYFAVSNREELDNWGWPLALGIVNAIVGLLLIMNPEVSKVTLSFYVGFVLLFRSVFAIGASLDLKGYRVMDWCNLMAIGIHRCNLFFYITMQSAFCRDDFNLLDSFGFYCKWRLQHLFFIRTNKITRFTK